MPSTLSEYEVEEKFPYRKEDSEIYHDRLKSEFGFAPTKSISFVDWYFDNPTNGLTTTLDCWFRYRESGSQGAWQLKMGIKSKSKQSSNATTVYREFQGGEAVDEMIVLLNDIGSTEADHNYADDDALSSSIQAPELPSVLNNFDLAAFARIGTTRTTWKATEAAEKYNDLVVDFDVTNTGFAVGEVEVVVDCESKLPEARKQVRKFLDELVPERNTTAVGKLEHFLMNHRPAHFAACLEGGTMKKKE